MNKNWWFFLFLFCLFSYGRVSGQNFRVMTYNVENLFDTCHDQRFDDHEFLPSSERKWGAARYWKKQDQLSRVVAAAGGISPVELVALCEVENDSVLRDLTQRTMLNRLGYRFVVTDSRDSRGLDVALLYQPERLGLISYHSYQVPFQKEKERPTRDILHVVGRMPNGDTLDVFVCHFPSRRGGVAFTRSYRLRAAGVVRSVADSLVRCREKASVVILGDFNDEPKDATFTEGFQVVGWQKALSEKTMGYVLLSEDLFALEEEIAGTYRYKGRWNRLDHIVVNGEFVHRTDGWHVDNCRILSFPFLLEKTIGESPVWQPFRTYRGPHYHGGISDHLPLLLELKCDD